MSETPPFDPSTLRSGTSVAKKRAQGRPEGEEQDDHEEEEKRNQNGAASGTSMPFAGEMERRGEEKVHSSRMTEESMNTHQG